MHLQKIKERTNDFSKRYYLLGFSNCLNLPKIMQYNFFIFLTIENISLLFDDSVQNNSKKKSRIINQTFTFKHKINKSNSNVLSHYRFVCLYSINICYYIFVSYEFFNFLWNIFNSKTIKIYYFICIHMQNYSMRSYWFKPMNIYYICPILYFRYIIFRRKTPINLGSFW